MNKKIVFRLMVILPLLILVGCNSPASQSGGEIDQVKVSADIEVNFPIEFLLSIDLIQPSAVSPGEVKSIHSSNTNQSLAVIPSGIVVDKVFDFDYKQICRENNLDPDALEELTIKKAVLKFKDLPQESIKLLENLELSIQGKNGTNQVVGKVKKGQSNSEIVLDITHTNLKDFLVGNTIHLIILNNGEEFTLPETTADLMLIISAKATVYKK